MKKVILILLALSYWQCARQSQPAGGPQDKDAPVLDSSNPANGEKNFKGRAIELTFNEFIKLKDAQEEIVITPPLEGKTKYQAKKNKVILTPEKNWRDSTTYSIAFRGSIQDINESNPADDLHLAFSTGSTIDSLQISGRVTEAFKEKIPEKILVALYQADTFDIFKHKPTYFAKTNSKGRFSIQNLKAGKYFIYAFDDKNKNFKVDSKSERFGFSAAAIQLPEKKDSLLLELIHADSRPIKITSIRNTKNTSIIRFNKPLDSLTLKSSSYLKYSYGDNSSEIVVQTKFDKQDSLLVNISASDSLMQELDTAVYIKYSETKKIDERFKTTKWQFSFNPETKELHGSTQLNKLIKQLAYDSAYIQLDTVSFQPIKKQEITFDTLKKILAIKTSLDIKDQENIPIPVILFGKGFIISTDQDSTKSEDVKLTIPKTKNTGILSIEVQTNKTHFEIQLINSQGNVIASSRDIKKITFKYLDPGEYKIIAIIDENNNHRWDPGNFYKKVEPEKAILYKNSENKYMVPIRANWEVGPLVITF